MDLTVTPVTVAEQRACLRPMPAWRRASSTPRGPSGLHRARRAGHAGGQPDDGVLGGAERDANPRGRGAHRRLLLGHLGGVGHFGGSRCCCHGHSACAAYPRQGHQRDGAGTIRCPRPAPAGRLELDEVMEVGPPLVLDLIPYSDGRGALIIRTARRPSKLSLVPWLRGRGPGMRRSRLTERPGRPDDGGVLRRIIAARDTRSRGPSSERPPTSTAASHGEESDCPTRVGRAVSRSPRGPISNSLSFQPA